MSRMVRRIIIATVFFVLNALFWTGVYYAFIKAPETCFDMKQNQNEEGVAWEHSASNTLRFTPPWRGFFVL
jgi:hypothetical protein